MAMRCLVLLLVAAVVKGRGSHLECAARPPSDEYRCGVDSDEPMFPCLENGFVIGQGRNCTPLAGMSVTILCTNSTLVLYSKGVSLSGFSVTYPRVNSSHAGLYECRDDADANNNGTQVIRSSRTVEVRVSDTPMIGLLCGDQDIVNLNNGSQVCGLHNIALPFQFNLYCVNCSVILDTEWTYHIGVDLDLKLNREDEGSTVYTIAMGPNSRVPYPVGSYVEPIVTILVTAVTSQALKTVSGFRMMFYQYAAGLYAKLIPPSLPNLSLGKDAEFQCEFSDEQHQAYVVIELTLANGTTYAGTCNPSSCFGLLALDSANSSKPDIPFITIHVGTLTLHSLTEEYNNSQVTCSLWFENAIQWKNTTDLVIIPQSDFSVNPLQNEPLSPTMQCPLYCKAVVGGLVSGAALVVALVFVIIILMLYLKPRNKSDTLKPTMNNLKNMEEYDAPTNGTCGSTVILPLSNIATATSADSLNSNLASSRCTSLVIANRRVKSMSEITTREKFNFENRCFYISCSEEKTGWVTEYLKPLVQRLIVGSEVIVPSDSMLAGHPITEERMRLILEADKMLVVCSPGYESSPWCQYELLQSVTMDPSLIEGRIVPILCDSCIAAPLIISGVASIRIDDSMFESKLQKCLKKSIVRPIFADH